MSGLGDLRPDRVVRATTAAAVDIGRAGAEFVIGATGELLHEAVLRGTDAVLRSPVTGEVLDKVLASELLRATVIDAVRGPVVAAVLEPEVLDAILTSAEEAGAPELIVDRVLSQGIAEEIAVRVVEGPELARILDVALASEQMQATISEALDSPALQRIAAQAIDSRLVDEVVRSLLTSEELWLLVAEIAESPQVTDALSRQTAGVAGQITDEVRVRSRSADDWVERIAHRVARRRAKPDNVLPAESEPPGGPA